MGKGEHLEEREQATDRRTHSSSRLHGSCSHGKSKRRHAPYLTPQIRRVKAPGQVGTSRNDGSAVECQLDIELDRGPVLEQPSWRMLAHANKRKVLRPRQGAVVLRVFAAALVAAVGIAQMSASWHEANVRHVRCAEHGEAIDVGVHSDARPSATGDHANSAEFAERAQIEGTPSTEAVSHDHCSVVFAFRASARAQLLRLATRLIPPPVVVRGTSEPAPRPGRAFVLASAPKTSPPSAQSGNHAVPSGRSGNRVIA